MEDITRVGDLSKLRSPVRSPALSPCRSPEPVPTRPVSSAVSNFNTFINVNKFLRRLKHKKDDNCAVRTSAVEPKEKG